MKKKNLMLIFSFLLVMTFYVGITKSNAEGSVKSGYTQFTISKVDESGNPLKGATFGVIGGFPKPTLESSSQYYSYDSNKKQDLTKEWKEKDLEYSYPQALIEQSWYSNHNAEPAYVKFRIDLTKVQIAETCNLDIKTKLLKITPKER